MPHWQHILRQNFTRWESLADFLELSPEQRKYLHKTPSFPLNLPLRLAHKIQKTTLDDPILRQFLPTIEENRFVPGFGSDPVDDEASRCAPKLLHKYQGRVLLVCTSACAMHCRYCFRQHFDYSVTEKSFSNELDVIRKDNTIREVILSGGDPLSLSNRVLEELLEGISNIEHIRRVRIHTRFPIGIPERIDDGFLALLSECRPQIWFVIHVNHPSELDQDIFAHLRLIQKLGIPVLNQGVLLRGINDTIEVQKTLCEQLVDHGISPYYMHQLDRVQGASHFEVPIPEGQKLIGQLTPLLPGYAVPEYVKEVAGEPAKSSLTKLKLT